MDALFWEIAPCWQVERADPCRGQHITGEGKKAASEVGEARSVNVTFDERRTLDINESKRLFDPELS